MALNANALVSTALVKKWLKIPSTDITLDDVVEVMINGFSQEIETLTGRLLISGTVTEIKHGRGSNLVLTHQYPVTAITSVTIDWDDSADEPLDASEYAIADNGNAILLLRRLYPRGYNNIELVYTAGYATVPADLQQACLDLCYWKHRTRESGDIGRIQKGKASESEQWSQVWPPGALATVMRYKRYEMPNSDAPVFNI